MCVYIYLCMYLFVPVLCVRMILCLWILISRCLFVSVCAYVCMNVRCDCVSTWSKISLLKIVCSKILFVWKKIVIEIFSYRNNLFWSKILFVLKICFPRRIFSSKSFFSSHLFFREIFVPKCMCVCVCMCGRKFFFVCLLWSKIYCFDWHFFGSK